MARSQFTFTFPNAQPGASVTFSAAVYSSKVDADADGPTLVLDSARSIAVWTDATELTATWKDGAGLPIAAEASLDRPVVTASGGVPGESAASGALSVYMAVAVPGNEFGPVATVILPTTPPPNGLTAATLSDGQLHHANAGQFFQMLMTAPTYTAGTLTTESIEFAVVNAANTQRLVLSRYDTIPVPSGGDPALLSADWLVTEQVGSDLSVTNTEITTAAGGDFFVKLLAQFATVGLAG